MMMIDDDTDWYLKLLAKPWTKEQQKKYSPVEGRRVRAMGHIILNGLNARDLRSHHHTRFSSLSWENMIDNTKDFKEKEKDYDI